MQKVFCFWITRKWLMNSMFDSISGFFSFEWLLTQLSLKMVFLFILNAFPFGTIDWLQALMQTIFSLLLNYVNILAVRQRSGFCNWEVCLAQELRFSSLKKREFYVIESLTDPKNAGIPLMIWFFAAFPSLYVIFFLPLSPHSYSVPTILCSDYRLDPK